jgi:hypothetical protein
LSGLPSGLGPASGRAASSRLQLERERAAVAALFLDLDHVAERFGPRGFAALGPRSSSRPFHSPRVDSGLRCTLLVSARRRAPSGIGRDVLGPVHRRGAEQVGRGAQPDDDIALAGEAVAGVSGPCALHQRQPAAAAIGIEARDVERAVVEQVAVGLALRRVHRIMP